MNNSEKSCSEVVPLLLHRHFVVRLQLEAITKGLLFQSKYLFSLSFMFSFIWGGACLLYEIYSGNVQHYKQFIILVMLLFLLSENLLKGQKVSMK